MAKLAESKTDVELKQLAMDVFQGKVYTDRHIPPGQERNISMVFMPIALGAFAGFTDEDFKEVGMVYEYLEKAGPRSINGMPSFFSMRIINATDMEKFVQYYDEAKKAMASFLTPSDPHKS